MTAVAGIGDCHSMVLADDIVLARDYVAGVGNHKWNKPELQAAAAAMAWIIREIPGSPVMIRAMVDMLGKDPTNGLNKATALLRAQQGLHGDLGAVLDEAGEPISSTQRPGGAGLALSWADVSASQIPSAQGDDTGTSTKGDGDGGGTNTNSVGKVSDRSSFSDHSLATPVQFPNGPHTGAAVGGRGEVVDAVANGSSVTGVGGVGGVVAAGDVGTNRRVGEAPLNGAPAPVRTPWRPRVCNRVWKGKICKSNGCRFAHPNPCDSSRCSGGPTAGCKAFHPRVGGVETSVVLGNGKGSARRGGTAPNRNRKGRPDSNSGRSSSSYSNNNRRTPAGNRGSGNGSSGSRSGSSSSTSNSNFRHPQVSYRDVAARAVPSVADSASGSNGGSNNSIFPFQGRGGFAHVQPDPAVLSTVVAAVMAVLSGRGQHC